MKNPKKKNIKVFSRNTYVSDDAEAFEIQQKCLVKNNT